MGGGGGLSLHAVERLYCKRQIQCLASSKILTPHPLTARRVCTPPPLVRGEDTLAGWRAGWGVNILEDARHCSVLYISKYFVLHTDEVYSWETSPDRQPKARPRIFKFPGNGGGRLNFCSGRRRLNTGLIQLRAIQVFTSQSPKRQHHMLVMLTGDPVGSVL